MAEQGKAGAAEGGDTVRLAPDSFEDEQVIRHELGHILQQRNAQGRGPAQRGGQGEKGSSAGAVGAEGEKAAQQVAGESSAEVSSEKVDLESEADGLARAAAAGESFEVRGEGQGVLYEEAVEPDAVEPAQADAVAPAVEPAQADAATQADAAAPAQVDTVEPAQAAILKGLEEDHQLYVAELETLTASSKARVREALPALPELAGVTPESIETLVDSRLEQMLSKSLESLKDFKASLADNPEPRGELRKKHTEILATYESDLTLFADKIPGAKPLPPLVTPLEGEDLKEHFAHLAEAQKAIYESWQAITAGFREGVGKTGALPADLQEECVTSLTAKYDELSAALHALYPKAEEPLKEEAVTNLEGTLNTIEGSAQGMYETWLDARLAQAVAEVSPMQPTGQPKVDGFVQGARMGAADGAKDVVPKVTPYASIEEVKAAQKAWLQRLELAWASNDALVLDWAVGQQSDEARDVLSYSGKKKPGYPKPNKGSEHSLTKMEGQAEKATLQPVEALLVSGALEARRHFEIMQVALDRSPQPTNKENVGKEPDKDGTYNRLPIMGPTSAYRTFEEQWKSWSGKMNAKQDEGGLGKEDDKLKGELKSSPGTLEAEAAEVSGGIIKRGKAATGMSRHGYCTDFDLGTTTDDKGKTDYEEEFAWLELHAQEFGFFRPYRGAGGLSKKFLELKDVVHVPAEFWHWSYYPVAQAFWELIHKHWNDDLEEKLKDRISAGAGATPGSVEELKLKWTLENLEMLHNGINTKLPGEK